MANMFDQFDEPESFGNVFDQFDEPRQPKPASRDPWDAYARHMSQQQSAPDAEPENDDWQITRGFKAGIDQTQAMGGALAAVAGDALGADKLREWGLESYQKNMQEAEAHGGNVKSWADIEDLGGLADYVLYGAGNAVAQFLPSIVAGGAGSLIGRQLVKKSAIEILEKELKKGATREQAVELARKKLIQGQVAGGTAAAVTTSAGLSTGEIGAELYEETGDLNPGVAAGFGLLAGSLDALPVTRVLDKVGLGKEFRDRVTQSVVKDVGIQALYEGGTEGLQTVIEKAAIKFVDENKDIFTAENLVEIGDAIALGALGGSVVRASTRMADGMLGPNVGDGSGSEGDAAAELERIRRRDIDAQAEAAAEKVKAEGGDALSAELARNEVFLHGEPMAGATFTPDQFRPIPTGPAGPSEGGGSAVDFDALENGLIAERDQTSAEIENEWMNGADRRHMTPIERAIYDAVTASTLDAGNAAEIVRVALENGRTDLAEYAVRRAENFANGMNTTPGVPQGSPKYQAIKDGLDSRKKDALAAAASLRGQLAGSGGAGVRPSQSATPPAEGGFRQGMQSPASIDPATGLPVEGRGDWVSGPRRRMETEQAIEQDEQEILQALGQRDQQRQQQAMEQSWRGIPNQTPIEGFGGSDLVPGADQAPGRFGRTGQPQQTDVLSANLDGSGRVLVGDGTQDELFSRRMVEALEREDQGMARARDDLYYSQMGMGMPEREPVAYPQGYQSGPGAREQVDQAQIDELEKLYEDTRKQMPEREKIKRGQKIANVDMDVLQYIAAKGGVSLDEGRARGFDSGDIRKQIGGFNRVFTSRGMTFDGMAEAMAEDGFFQGRDYTANELEEMVRRALGGELIFSPQSNKAGLAAAIQSDLERIEAAIDDLKSKRDEDATNPPKGRVWQAESDPMRQMVYTLTEAEAIGVPQRDIDRILDTASTPEQADALLKQEIDLEKQFRRFRFGSETAGPGSAEGSEAALGSSRPQEEGRGQEASPAERLIAAQARRNQAEANKDVNAMIDAGDEASTALIEGIQAEMDAGRMPVIQDGSLYHAIHSSTSRPGKLQITTYNDTGALSDTTVDGMDGVQRELNASKARIMPADEANETMNRIGRAEAEYQQRRKDFDLTQETEAQRAERERAEQEARDAEARQQQEAEEKAKADAERGDFTLTGSDRPADVLAAQGQGGLFEGGTDAEIPDGGTRGPADAQADETGGRTAGEAVLGDPEPVGEDGGAGDDTGGSSPADGAAVSGSDTAADGQSALILTKGGTPFKTEAAAKIARGRKDLKGRTLTPVQVDGGWALQESGQAPAPAKVDLGSPTEAQPKARRRGKPELLDQIDSLSEQAKGLPVAVAAEDLPYQDGYEAYRNISHTPDDRALQEQIEYLQEMLDIHSFITERAPADADIAGEMQRYRDNYLRLAKAVLSAKSRTASSFIAGGSNFPVERNRKRLATEQRRLDEFLEWRKKARNAIRKKFAPEESKVVSSTDPEAISKLRRKLEAAEQAQDRMKAANKIVRSKKLSHAEKVQSLQDDAGLTEEQARELLKPDFAGRPGFPQYALSNNNAEIKRLRGRISALEARKETAEAVGGSVTAEFEGGQVEVDYEGGYVRIRHDEKPSAEVRQALKSGGFRWAPSEGAWRRKLSNQALFRAGQITGAEMPSDGVSDSEGLYSVEARRGAYNPDQSDLFVELEAIKNDDPYENLETRPGTTERQRAAGRSALSDLFRQLTARYRRGLGVGSNDRGEISLLGASIYKGFVAGEPAQLIGQTVESAADLAAVAQVYRDPRFETFRFILTKNGKVVGETGVTSRLPAAVSLQDRNGDTSHVWRNLQGDMDALGADGYYMLHNHPSGRSIPSKADLRTTVNIAKKVGGFQSHVVIDHNEYSTIDSSGAAEVINAPELNNTDFFSDPEKPHEYLGVSIKSSHTLASMGKRLQMENDAVLVLTNAPGKIALIASLPMDALRGQGSAAGRAALRRLSRVSGSGGRAFVVLPKNTRPSEQEAAELVEGADGFAADVVMSDGEVLSDLYLSAEIGRKLDFSGNTRALTVGEQGAGYDGHSEATLRAAMESAFKGVGKALEDGGLLKVITSDQIPASIRGASFSVTAYHGTPHRFDRFSLDAIGSGEGNQAYGWGLYFAGKQEVAEFYRDSLRHKGFDISEEARAIGIDLNAGGRGAIVRQTRENPESTNEQIARKVHNENRSSRDIPLGVLADFIGSYRERGQGQTYQVKLPPEDSYLLWDRPLSEQSDKVKDAISKARKMLDDRLDTMRSRAQIYTSTPEAISEKWTGEDFYSIAIEMFENDDSAWQLIGKTPLDMRIGGSTVAQAASEYLKSLGINGIKYLDGNSRDGSGDSYNYVVFDDSLIEIEEVFYSKAGRIQGYVKDGVVHMVADNISRDTDVKGLMMHEIGVHLTKLGRSDAEFQSILKHMEALRKSSPKVQAAFARVPKDTPAHLVSEEALGYLAERNPNMPLAKRILSWFRAKLREWGGKLKGLDRARFMKWANDLTADDLVYMAQSATRQAADVREARRSEGVVASESGETIGLYHTSPERIDRVTSGGRFGSFLSFSDRPYVMTAASDPVTYRVDVAPGEIIEAEELFYHDNASALDGMVADLADQLSIDTETAENLISQQESIYNIESSVEPEGLADTDWDIQRMSAEAARALGYRGVSMQDEQGTVYLLDMEGREAELRGNDYPAMASRQRQTDTPEFRRWFGDSKVVDENGEPLVVYHGTTVEFSAFDQDASDNKVGGWWFTDSHNYAYDIANGGWDTRGKENPDARVMGVYLRMNNPMHYDVLAEGERLADEIGVDPPADPEDAQQLIAGSIGWDNVVADLVEDAKRAGHDGLIIENFQDGRVVTSTAFIAFNPEQIKSAIGNRGTFDPADPDIRMSRARHPFTLSGQNPSDGSQTGIRAQSLLARHWGEDPAASVQAAIQAARRESLPDVVDWLKVNRGRVMPAEAGQGDVVFSRADDSLTDAEAAREEMNRRVREEHHGTWFKAKGALKRYFAPGGLLPEPVFKAKIKRDSQMGAEEMDIEFHVGGLEHAFRKDYGKPFDQRTKEEEWALADALAGRISDEIPESTRRAIEAMRQHIDTLSERYVQILESDVQQLLGSLPEDRRSVVEQALLDGNTDGLRQNELQVASKLQLMQTIGGNIGEYVHRSYRAFDDPMWPRNVPSPVLNNARDYLEARYLEQNEGAGQSEAAQAAQRVINDILKKGTAFDSMEAFIRETKLGHKDLSLLKRRKVIAPEIRALMGEHQDPRVNFAKTATKMSRLIHNDVFLKRVREVGMGTFLFEEGQQPEDGFTATIAADSSEAYAPLNGLRTTPEINQAFIDALGKEQLGPVFKKIVQMNGAVKFGKTVLSPTTAARNFLSAYFFTMANGHFNLRHAKKSKDSVGSYFKRRGDAFQYLKRLKQLGVIYDTPYAGEMMRLLEDTDLKDRLLNGRLKGQEALNMAQRFYQFGDDFWKVIGFENEVDLQMKHRNITRDEAEVIAAERIRNTYPTYSMTGKFLNHLRRFPLAGTFVSFPAEIIRTTFNMLKYAKEDMAHSRALGMRRVTGLAAVSAFAYAAQELSKHLLDVDDEEEEAIRNQAPSWSQNSNMVFLSREDGNLKYLDVSFLDPYNYWKRPITAIMRDDVSLKDTAIQSAGEMLAPFFGTDIAFGALAEIWSNKKATGGRVYNESDMAMEQTADIANHLRKAIQPGAFANAERLLKAAVGEKTTYGKEYTMSDELAALVGFRVSTLDPVTSLRFRTFEASDSLRDASSILSRVARDPNPVDDEDLRETFDRVTGIRKGIYTDLLKSIKAARKSGLDDRAIFRQLQAGGLSKRDAAILTRGQIPPRLSSKQYLMSAIRSAGDTLGPEVQKEMNRRRLQILRWERQEAQRSQQ